MPESSMPRQPTADTTQHASRATRQTPRAPLAAAPLHTWFTSPAYSHSGLGKGKELPLHLIQLILEYLDDVGDLARITRTSRLFYYMTLPRLYEHVTLHSYAEMRYVDGRPEGFGSGSPFAMGLNTLVTRTVAEYVQGFRVVGDWREHDVEEYSKGRVPDNAMLLQIAMRAAIDRMKNLRTFAWELSTKPLQTIYEGLMQKPLLTKLTLRFPTRRIPRPTTTIPPLPNLTTLVLYDIDPLCYPDNISLLLFTSKRLANLKMHWSPRMRDSGEESVNLLQYFGRCLAAKHQIPLRRIAMYNLYARNHDEGIEDLGSPNSMQEMTIINSMGTADPMSVFLENTWRIKSNQPVPPNLKMMRVDAIDKEHAQMLSKFQGLERLYLISSSKCPKASKDSSTAVTPATPAQPNDNTPTTTTATTNGFPSLRDGPVTEHQCKALASDYLAVISANHRTMRHLLLHEKWQLSIEAISHLCQSCPNLEQLGFASDVPQFSSLRGLFELAPKLWAVRFLIPPGSKFAEKMDSIDLDLHVFTMATELWRPAYRNLRYFGLGDRVFKLGGIVFPSKGRPGVSEGQEESMNARRVGPMRKVEAVERESVAWIEIWGRDSTEFDPCDPEF